MDNQEWTIQSLLFPNGGWTSFVSHHYKEEDESLKHYKEQRRTQVNVNTIEFLNHATLYF